MKDQQRLQREATQLLTAAQTSAHGFRLKVSGSVLSLGTALLVSSQALIIVHQRGVQPMGNYAPPIGSVGSQLGQALMLLALQPSDKIMGVIAASLLVILCAYYIASFPFATVQELETIEATRSWLFLVLEVILGNAFLYALRRRSRRWQMRPRARLEHLWRLWRFQATSISLLEAGSVVAVLTRYDSCLDDAAGEPEPQAEAEAEAEAQPEGEPEAEGEPESEPEAEAEPEYGNSTAPEPEPEGEPEAEAEPEYGNSTNGTAPEPEGEPEAEPESEPESEPEPEAYNPLAGCHRRRRLLGSPLWEGHAVSASPWRSSWLAPTLGGLRAPLGTRRLQEPEPEPLADASDEPAVITSFALHGLCILVALIASRRNRRRAHGFLSQLETRGEVRAAATVSALLGGIDPRVAIHRAEESFRGILFSELREADLLDARLNAREEGDSLAAHSKPCALGSVHCFLSHSWNDEAKGKYAALQLWATEFANENGHEPMLWLDKACISQLDIEMSLKVLPVYLSLTRTMLIVAGPTYHRRLWCILEVFTFLRMGAGLSRIMVRPIVDSGDAEKSMAQVRQAFQTLRVQEAGCFSADQALLWAAIETGFASLDEFNGLCSAALLHAIDATKPLRLSALGGSCCALPAEKEKVPSNATHKGAVSLQTV